MRRRTFGWRLRLTILALAIPFGCTSTSRSNTTEAEQLGPGCPPTLATDELPSWFEAGATPRGIVGVERSVVAIPFVSELKVHPSDQANKVLIELQTRTTNGRLQITGSLGEVTVDNSRKEFSERESSLPGYLDVPSPGCWRFDLKWDTGEDTFYLRYD